MAGMVEAHLDGWKMWDDIVRVRYSVVVGELAPDIICKILVADSRRSKSVEIELV